jgi:hypothetical protein
MGRVRVGTGYDGSAGFDGTGQRIYTGRIRTGPFWGVWLRPVLDPSGRTGRRVGSGTGRVGGSNLFSKIPKSSKIVITVK